MRRHTPFNDLLDAFSASDPTPGGGAASALAGAVGASLLTMVAGLAKTRYETDEDRLVLDAAREALSALRGTLAELMDADADAYDRVVAAFHLPASTDAETTARASAIQAAFRGATETPLSVMLACEEVIRHGDLVAERGNPSAAGDALVGLELAFTGFRGARLHAEINLASLKDTAFVEQVKSEIERLTRAAETGAARARGRLG
jgi:formiminotetrahydrofolate cyclodeaminase